MFAPKSSRLIVAAFALFALTAITVNANWDGSGNYTIDFKETKWTGIYKIEVFSPGGKGYGTQTFSAKPAKEMSAEVQSGEDQTIKLVQTDIKGADDATSNVRCTVDRESSAVTLAAGE